MGNRQSAAAGRKSDGNTASEIENEISNSRPLTDDSALLQSAVRQHSPQPNVEENVMSNQKGRPKNMNGGKNKKKGGRSSGRESETLDEDRVPFERTAQVSGTTPIRGSSVSQTTPQNVTRTSVNLGAHSQLLKYSAPATVFKAQPASSRNGPIFNGTPSTSPASDDDCAICMCPITQPKRLPCGHKFCTVCIDRSFQTCQPKCPLCGRLCGQMQGNQPKGTMTVRINNTTLPGYRNCNTLEIEYDIPDGIQDNSHPNPGQKYHGTRRFAYLPNNPEGQEVFRLLRQAFDAKLIFTVGRSITTGQEDCVIWNDIHHKTSPTGQFGYPDASYLSRVKEELKAKGIVSSNVNPVTRSGPSQQRSPTMTSNRKTHRRVRPQNNIAPQTVDGQVPDVGLQMRGRPRGQQPAAGTNPFALDTPHGIHVEIYTGDLLNEQVDALVNPANPFLSHAAGAAKAIADAAGLELVRECHRYKQTYGELKMTTVMHTTAGHMRPRVHFIIHAAGPPADYFPDQNELYSAVFETFDNCLRYANDVLNIKSLAIPAISSGIFGVPKEMVAEAAYNALMRFDDIYSIRSRSLGSVHFVNLDKQATSAFVSAFSGRPTSSAFGRRRSSSQHKLPAKSMHMQSTLNQQGMTNSSSYTGQQTVINAAMLNRQNAVDKTSSDGTRLNHADSGDSGGHHTPTNPTAQTLLNFHKTNDTNANNLSHTGNSRHLMQHGTIARLSATDCSNVLQVTPQPPDVASLSRTVSLMSVNDDCAICMCPITQPKTLPCGHKFCTVCIDRSFQTCQPKCPICGRLCGQMQGNQPKGKMTSRIIQQQLAGFRGCNTIEIEYNIPSGIQDDTHPNPRRPYKGTKRHAYIPDNAEGQEVLRLLRQAFDAKLVFTVGRSITTGNDDCVIWNDIHHKTSLAGPYGYPDPSYLSRVKEELKAKGIVSLSPGTAPTTGGILPKTTASTNRNNQKSSPPLGQSKAANRSTSSIGSDTSDRGGTRASVVVNGARNKSRKTANKITLKDILSVDEYLWKFIDKYYKQDIRNICGRRAKFTYTRASYPHQLEIESTDGQCVKDVSDKVAVLCQKLTSNTADEIVSIPPGIDADEVKIMMADLAKHNQIVFYCDAAGNHHIVGAHGEVKSVKKHLNDLLMNDQRALSNQSVGSQPTKTYPFTLDTPNGIHIEIYSGNLVEEHVEALVNPASTNLQHGGGAAKAIANAAGRQLTQECRQYIQTHGELKMTHVMYTTAGRLRPRVQFVIHAAGPPANRFPDKQKLHGAVLETYRNCLLCANNQLKVRSLAIPAIGAGMYDVPKRMVADAAAEALMRFDNISNRSISAIHFVNLDGESTMTFVDVFGSMNWTSTTSTTPRQQKARSNLQPPADSDTYSSSGSNGSRGRGRGTRSTVAKTAVSQSAFAGQTSVSRPYSQAANSGPRGTNGPRATTKQQLPAHNQQPSAVVKKGVSKQETQL